MSSPPERLTLTGLVCACRIGVTEEERSRPQRLEVDLDLYAVLHPAGRSGDLTQTIDYRQVSDGVRGLLEAKPYSLIEAAAVAVLDHLFERFPSLLRARVRVRKFVLPKVAHVEIEMERERPPRAGQVTKPPV